MRPFGIGASSLGVLIASLMAGRGVKRRSLSLSGAVAAWGVGFLSIASGLRGMILLLFYIVGTAATKFRHGEKARRDATAQVGAERGPEQVLACSIVGVACSLCHVLLCGEERTIDFKESPLASSLTCGQIAHYAACLADTLASELGILANQQPILVTRPWTRVPPGTNGGITFSGTCWGGIGGLIIAAGTLCMDHLSGITAHYLETLAFGVLCGILGSLLDSILGALLQSSYYDDEKKCAHSGEEGEESVSKLRHISGTNILTNAQVNLVSVLATTFLGAHIVGPFVYGFF